MKFYLPNELEAIGFREIEIDRFLEYQHRKHQQKNAANRGRSHNGRSDSQRKRTYQSEWAYHNVWGNGKKFENIEEIQAYCNRILKSSTWKKLSNRKSITISAMKDMGWRQTCTGQSSGPRIEMAPRSFNQYTLFHEMAHSAGAMHHDVGFRQNLIKLVSRFIGVTQAKALHKEFRARGLKMNLSINLKTPDAWLVMFRRLELARLAKNNF